MLYTISEAAKGMRLEQSLILKAIEDGQITATKNVSGEWHVDDVELNLLYLHLARDYCKHQWQPDLPRSQYQDPEIANIAHNDEGRIEQERTERRPGLDQAEASPSIPEMESTWQEQIRLDDRERISASGSRRGSQPNRARFITVTLLLALGCIGALSSLYLFGRNRVLEQNANPSSPVLGSEKASMPVALAGCQGAL